MLNYSQLQQVEVAEGRVNRVPLCPNHFMLRFSVITHLHALFSSLQVCQHVVNALASNELSPTLISRLLKYLVLKKRTDDLSSLADMPQKVHPHTCVQIMYMYLYMYICTVHTCT